MVRRSVKMGVGVGGGGGGVDKFFGIAVPSSRI